MSRAHDPCAMCARFITAGYDQQAATGNGWCEAWEKFVPWNGQAGVLFNLAKDQGQRARYVEQQRNKQTETA